MNCPDLSVDSRLRSRLLLFIVMMTALIITSYLYLDRPLLLWTHGHSALIWRQFFQFFVTIPVFLYALSGATLIIFGFLLLFRHQFFSYWQKTLIAAAISQYIAMGLKVGFKYFFGRYTPELYLSQHLYGFHWVRYDFGEYAFPSGHTTATFAYLTMIWLRCRCLRFICFLLSILVAVSLVALMKHFLSDVFAGALLGVLVAYCTSHLIFRNKATLS